MADEEKPASKALNHCSFFPGDLAEPSPRTTTAEEQPIDVPNDVFVQLQQYTLLVNSYRSDRMRGIYIVSFGGSLLGFLTAIAVTTPWLHWWQPVVGAAALVAASVGAFVLTDLLDDWLCLRPASRIAYGPHKPLRRHMSRR
jgi:hypothetical protein